MQLLNLVNLDKKYNENTSAEVHALKTINLSIEQGELTAVIGKSGSGKSTLLHILGCLDNFTGGQYRIHDKNITQLKEKELAALRNQYFGFVLQDFGLILNKTVFENISFPLIFNHTVKYGEIQNRVEYVLRQVGLLDKMKSKCSQLSGGQRQRVAIARAIVNNPEIILADEPTGALDQKTGQEIMNVLKEINLQGKTVIIVTHDMGIAHQCNRLIEISDGEIIES